MRRILSTAVLACQTTWNLSKVMRAFGRCVATPLMKVGDMSMLTVRMASAAQPRDASSLASVATVSALRPSATASTRRSTASAASVM